MVSVQWNALVLAAACLLLPAASSPVRHDEGFDCTAREEGLYADVPSGCTFYYLCLRGRKFVAKCPPNTLFDEESSTCLEAPLGKCSGTDDVTDPSAQLYNNGNDNADMALLNNLQVLYDCSHMKDGFYPDVLSKCSRFFACVNGKLSDLLQCPPGSLYNADKNACDEASAVTRCLAPQQAMRSGDSLRDEMNKEHVPRDRKRAETRQIKFKRLVQEDQQLIRDLEALTRALDGSKPTGK